MKQTCTLGTSEQGSAWGEPLIAIVYGDVGKRGICDKIVFQDDNVVAGATLGKQGIECTAVGAFVGVVDGVAGYNSQCANGAWVQGMYSMVSMPWAP